MLGNMCIVIVCLPGCNVINVEINFSFLIGPFSYRAKKRQSKNFKYFMKKEAFKIEWKASFIIFKVLSLKQMKQIILEGESPALTIKTRTTLVTSF